jgi:hypothetical protein
MVKIDHPGCNSGVFPVDIAMFELATTQAPIEH